MTVCGVLTLAFGGSDAKTYGWAALFLVPAALNFAFGYWQITIAYRLLGTLTARERDVLALMAEGRSNAAIAGILVVAERSIEKHVGNIFSKLGLARRTPTTAGCSPSSATWNPDRSHRRHCFRMCTESERRDLSGSACWPPTPMATPSSGTTRIWMRRTNRAVSKVT